MDKKRRSLIGKILLVISIVCVIAVIGFVGLMLNWMRMAREGIPVPIITPGITFFIVLAVGVLAFAASVMLFKTGKDND